MWITYADRTECEPYSREGERALPDQLSSRDAVRIEDRDPHIYGHLPSDVNLTRRGTGHQLHLEASRSISMVSQEASENSETIARLLCLGTIRIPDPEAVSTRRRRHRLKNSVRTQALVTITDPDHHLRTQSLSRAEDQVVISKAMALDEADGDLPTRNNAG